MKSSVYFITDCHFSETTTIDKRKIDSLGKIIKNDPNEFIYFVVSGDVAYSGQSIEYENFIAFFNQIKEISEKAIKLVTCPGNHDINFNGEEYSLQMLKEDTKKENVDKAFNERKTKMESYRAFERKYVKSESVDNFLSVSKFDDDEKAIVFYSLNNVLFSCFGKVNSSDVTRGYAYLSEESISCIKRSNPNQVVFLLMHFPLCYFDDETCHSFKNRISKNVDVLLNGHLHTCENDTFIGKENISIIQGNYFYKGDLDECGSFIKIDLKKNNYIEFKWEDDSYIQQDREISIDLNASRWNSQNIRFDNDYYSQLTNCEILGKKFSIKDIFVFPYLSREKYVDFDEKESSIREFPALLSKAKNNKFIYIYGDDASGKTSLSKYLTLLFFEENYFPILCNGNQLTEVKDIDKFIKKRIKEMYSESAVSKFYNEVEISSKVLIIDDYSPYENIILDKARDKFKSIIAITRLDKKALIKKPELVNGIEVLEYSIQPMVKSKRKEFTYKLHDALTNQGEVCKLNKEQFFATVEKQLNTLAVNDICDPIALAFIEINAFSSLETFDNTLFSDVNQARSLLMLDGANKKYNYNLITVKRVISHIAYYMYKNNKQSFSTNEINDAIKYETENYGETGIDSYEFSKMMLNALIVKELKDRSLTFFNRDIFSYYIASFIDFQIADNNISLFTDLLKKDITTPLNFNILMCLASIYKSTIIPNNIIDLIYEQAKEMPLLDDSNFSVAGITKEKQEELKQLTSADILKINEKQDEIEKERHEKYTKHRDDLYYVDSISKEVDNINKWLDKLKICCVLLKKFSATIKRPYKEKLINLIISLPNLVLYQFNDYMFKSLDALYATLKEKSSNPAIASTVSAFNDFIISMKRAFILSTYDYGSRCFTDYACQELLKASIKSGDGDLKIVQNLMLESFVIQEDSFINKCTNIINDNKIKDNSFVKVSAKLIGRRYIVENFELCSKNHKSFMNLIFESNKKALEYKAKLNNRPITNNIKKM